MTRNGNHDGWWSARWFRRLKAMGLINDPETLKSEARGARIQRLEVQTGLIEAQVRDKELGDCACRIRVATLNDEAWQQIIHALSEQAFYAAQLLAGELPREIEQLFQAENLALLPASSGDMAHECTCCDRRTAPQSCRPLLAVYVALGELLNEDPWLLFRLRGRDRRQILAGLREERSRAAGSQLAALPPAQPRLAEASAFYRAETQAAEHAPAPDDLTQDLDRFWGSAKPLQEFHHYIGVPPIELVALRRLGPLPVAQDGERVYDALSDIYRRITDAALTMAFAEESDEDGEETDELTV